MVSSVVLDAIEWVSNNRIDSNHQDHLTFLNELADNFNLLMNELPVVGYHLYESYAGEFDFVASVVENEEFKSNLLVAKIMV